MVEAEHLVGDVVLGLQPGGRVEGRLLGRVRVIRSPKSDEFAGGESMDPAFVEAFLKTIDCYVMGSRTYETALNFEAKGFGWSYGDKPTFVLTQSRAAADRDTVEFYAGDLAPFVNGRLRPAFRSIWFVGGGAVSGECLRLGLADEVRYSILPDPDRGWDFVLRQARQRHRPPPGGGQSVQERHAGDSLRSARLVCLLLIQVVVLVIFVPCRVT